ncbi:MAG: hypothetical protein LC114_03960 [Bryobacterales bacterium]|nr:hypothetical protein [Bryobacterales bacterium]
MKPKRSWLAALGLAVALFAAPMAQADPVEMVLTGVGNGTTASTSIGSVYIGPYNSNFGLVVCADFFIEAQLNQPWKANVSQSGADISATRQAALVGTESAQKLYNQAAYLVDALLGAYNTGNTTTQRQLSFALWGLFNDSAFDAITNLADRNAAIAFRKSALDYENVASPSLVIYTPVGLTATNASTLPPQEFLTIRTPEGSVTILWGLNILAAIALVVFFRRRHDQAEVSG